VEIGFQTGTLPFLAGNSLLTLVVNCGHDVNQGVFSMTFVSRLSVVTAYIAFAFVGAIVLGVF
jgi:hypothetical protein